MKSPSILGGFIISAPSASQDFYMPPDKSYRVVSPAGWAIIPREDGTIEFRSRLADQGYWPGMFIAKEQAEGFWPQEVEVNTLVAKDRVEFSIVSAEWMDLPVGRAYLVIYDHTFEKLRMRTAETHFVQGGMRYWIPFNALVATFDRHFPAYLNCLKTFTPQREDDWFSN